jgi:hypothetical protein
MADLPWCNPQNVRVIVPSFPSTIPEIQIQQQIDVESLRERLRGMTDEQLLHFGKASRYMSSRYANMGKSPLQAFVIQLEEAKAEWRRRRPKNTSPASTSE